MIVLLLLIFSAVSQANGQNETTYCAELANFIDDDLDMDSDLECDDLCTDCFGTAHNQCFGCSSILMGDVVNVREMCQDFAHNTTLRDIFDCSELNVRTVIIIAASAGGGAALLCSLATVVCCCCCIKKRRKKKSFDIHSGGQGADAPIIQGEMTSRSLENANLKQDLSPNKNEVDLQVLSAGDTVSSSSLVATSPATLPAQVIKKSASSYEITGSDGGITPSLQQDKGYVKMSSVGPLRFHSLQNLLSVDENEIYVEPDQPQGSSAAARTEVLTLSHTLRTTPSTPPPSYDAPKTRKHHKPATLPKPKALQANPRLLPQAAMPERKSDQSDDGEQDDDYVSPELFREDHDKQKVENYYNKDALIVPGKTRKSPAPPSSSGDTSEPQTIYANIDPSFEDHSSAASSRRSSSNEHHSSYESLRNYISDTGRKERDSMEYYNLPEAANRQSSPENEEMYVYMKSGQHIPTSEAASTPSPLPSKDRKRLESEPVGKGKKYVNFTREQELHKASKPKEKTADSAETRHKENGVSEDEMPLYANFDKTENEELYTEVT